MSLRSAPRHAKPSGRRAAQAEAPEEVQVDPRTVARVRALVGKAAADLPPGQRAGFTRRINSQFR
jgi:hypothetical protein